MADDKVPVVAWCRPNDPSSRSAFSWPGTDHRKKLHPVALVLATDYEAAIARAEAAEALQSATCRWTLSETTEWVYWETSCGESFVFDDGGPEDNNARFCHGCGKRIDAQQAGG